MARADRMTAQAGEVRSASEALEGWQRWPDDVGDVAGMSPMR
jgi:hypothetical protein